MRRTKQHTKKTDHEYVSQEEEKGNTYSEQNHCITLSELHGTNNYTHKSTHLKNHIFFYYDRAEYFFGKCIAAKMCLVKYTQRREEKKRIFCVQIFLPRYYNLFFFRAI